MQYTIHSNGSFDITGRISAMNAYPSVDGIAIRPIAVKAGNDAIDYILDMGSISLRFSHEGNDIVLKCFTRGIAPARTITPVACARLEGCDRLFHQGFGIAGPSGFVKFGPEAVESFGLIAAGNENFALALYATDHRRFNNRYKVENGMLSAGFDTECVDFGENDLPALIFREGDDYSQLLRSCAADIARTMDAKAVTRQSFHWCSWYYLYHNLDQATLDSYLEGFAKYRDIAPFTHIQIDAGYFPSPGDWLEPYYVFPEGLEHAAKKIKEAGYEPGIWIAPFMVGDNSKLFREHPDWMLRTPDGGFFHPTRQYNEPKLWGYRDCDYFVLDVSNPEALAHIRNVFSTLRSWGFTLFKTDFMLWGIQDSSKVKRHTPGKTSIEYYRDMMDAILSSIGDARWLGCIAPFLPSIGYVDMMRVAGDVGAQWEETGFGPANMLRELTADQYFNNLYWQNDPDAVMLRDFHIFIESEQIEALALLEAMSGGAFYTSDPIHLIGEERRKLLDFIRPDSLHDAEYPFWGELDSGVCILQRLETHTLVYFFNPTNDRIIRRVNWNGLLNGEKHLRRLHGGNFTADEIPYVEIAPRSGALFFATAEPLESVPKNMWKL